MKKIYSLIFFYLFVLFSVHAQKLPKTTPTPFSCGIKDHEFETPEIEKLMQQVSITSRNLRISETDKLECLVAVSIDKSLYEFYNKDTEVIKNRVYEVFAGVSKIFEKELNIKLTVSYIEFWDSREYTNISNFKDYWNSISQTQVKRNIPHLFKTNLVEEGALGISSTAISSTFDYYSAASSSGFAETNSVYNTLAHELGHNFGSPHTHSCKWANGPIDLCASIENGNCFQAGTTENRVGTIMSYCQNRAFTFHPLCIALMRNVAEHILPIINKAPENPTIAANYLSLTNAALSPYLNWNYSSRVDKYRIQISEKNDFSVNIVDSLLSYNQFQALNLKAETQYFWRVKATNSLGETAWTTTASLTTQKISDGLPDAPAIKSPAENAKDLNIINLEFYPSAGANEYEIQLTDELSYRYFGLSDNNIVKTNTTSYSIDLFKDGSKFDGFYSANFMGRIRAKNANGYSNWSRFFHFTRNVGINTSFPKDQQLDVPTNVPFSWTTEDTPIDRKYQLQLSTKPDFSANTITKQLVFNELGKVGNATDYNMSNFSLNPNTTYYYRLQDADNANNIWINNSFKTIANDTISKKWKFFNDENSPLLASKKVNSFYFAKNTANMWLGGVGLTSTDGINWSNNDAFSTKGVLKNYVESIDGDSKGNIWLSNDTQITKFDGKRFITYSSKNSSLRTIPYGIAVDKNDNVYTYCYENTNIGIELYKFDGNSWAKMSSPFSEKVIPILKSDLQKTIWTTTATGGKIAKLVGDTWTYYNVDKTKLYYILGLYPDNDGNLWVTTPNNVGKLSKDGTWTYLKPANLNTFRTADIAFDASNTPYLYIVDYSTLKSKLLKYVSNQWLDLSPTTPPIEVNTEFIKGIQFDIQNRLWIATGTNGLFVFDEQGKTKSQTITAETITNKRTTASPFDIKASASSSLPVAITVTSGPATVSGSKVTLTGQEGQVKLVVSQKGNEIYEPAQNVNITFEVRLKDLQTITFNTIPTKALGEPAFALGATASSGLPVTYTLVSGAATINNGMLSLTEVGKITVKASQAGNDDFAAATDVTQTFCVTPAIPVITSDVNNAYLLKSSSTTTNQWYFNGNKIAGATNPTYLATQNGKFIVEVTNPSSICPNVFSKEFVLLVLSSENDYNSEVKVFPNPASNILNVQVFAGTILKKIAVYSLSGNKLTENADKQDFVDVSQLTTGLYLLEVETNKGKTIRKFIKE